MQEDKVHLQEHVSLEFLKLHQFLHNKEKDIVNALREEGRALSEEMEHSLSQLQEQGAHAKALLASIKSRMEQQNAFEFLKVRERVRPGVGPLRWDGPGGLRRYCFSPPGPNGTRNSYRALKIFSRKKAAGCLALTQKVFLASS